MEQVALWSIEMALRDAGLHETYREARVGLVLGLGAEWMLLWEADYASGGNRVDDPRQDAETTMERVRREFGFSGPSLVLSAACASGNYALEIGRNWLRLGLVDVCVAGAFDMAVTPIGLATFGNLRALSRRNRRPRRRRLARSIAAGTASSSEKAARRSSWNARATPASDRRRLMPRSPAAAPAAMPTTT